MIDGGQAGAYASLAPEGDVERMLCNIPHWAHLFGL